MASFLTLAAYLAFILMWAILALGCWRGIVSPRQPWPLRLLLVPALLATGAIALGLAALGVILVVDGGPTFAHF